MAADVTGDGARTGTTPSGALTEASVYQLSPLALAYVGDAVWEVAVRSALVRAGETRPRRLHQAALDYVRAAGQADRLAKVLERLTERERDVVRRGRNAKPRSVPKSAQTADYRMSTGFEALFGYLYLSGQEKRMAVIASWLLAPLSQ